MKSNYYIHYFKGQGTIITLSNKDPFYRYIKEEFFNFTNYKWCKKKYKKFVSENNLSYHNCFKVLDDVYHLHAKYTHNSIGFKNFVKEIEKLNEIDNSRKITLNKSRDNESIAEIYNVIKKRTKTSKGKIIKHISDTIETGYTFSTLRSYFYDGRILIKPTKNQLK